MLFEPLHDRRDGGVLLTDRHVHARDALPLLVDDRIDRDCRLARAPIADDQLALAAADGNHRIDGFDARLERLFHGLPLDDARRHNLDFARLSRMNRTETIDRTSQRVDHTANHRRSDGHFEYAGGAADLVAFA